MALKVTGTDAALYLLELDATKQLKSNANLELIINARKNYYMNTMVID